MSDRVSTLDPNQIQTRLAELSGWELAGREIRLTSHDAGGLTSRDFRLAARIDA